MMITTIAPAAERRRWTANRREVAARMKIVIQCAASKHDCAGKLRTSSGEDVLFVADPKLCVSVPAGMRYARPDDPCGDKAATWRDVLKRYNEQTDNPCSLLRAADLYAPKEHVFRKLYQELVRAFGWNNVFILSAGWGLIRADFWTPDYNITFSAQGKKDKPWVWRNTKDRSWLDFNHLQDAPIAQDEPIHLFGGRDYLPTFYALVEAVPGRKIVHYMGDVKRRSSFDYEKYEGSEKNRTWHYRAAKEFVAGRAPQENQVPQ
jgi:hypothetical protein